MLNNRSTKVTFTCWAHSIRPSAHLIVTNPDSPVNRIEDFGAFRRLHELLLRWLQNLRVLSGSNSTPAYDGSKSGVISTGTRQFNGFHVLVQNQWLAQLQEREIVLGDLNRVEQTRAKIIDKTDKVQWNIEDNDF